MLEEPAARINGSTLYFPMTMDIRMVSTATMDITGLYDRFDEVTEFLSPATRDIEEKATELSLDPSGITIAADEFIDYDLVAASVTDTETWGDLSASTVEVDYSDGDIYIFKLNTDMLLGMIIVDQIFQAPNFKTLFRKNT